ncbi:MAG: hypothetical protein U0Y68_20805 [Blastocatellia bacterium]
MPLSNTVAIKPHKRVLPVMESTETLGDPDNPSQNLRTMNAGDVAGVSAREPSSRIVTRPGLIAAYAISAQKQWGGVIVKALRGISLQEWRDAQINKTIFKHTRLLIR